ncbi:hypothetical protein RJ640_000397, partial [Escallonia rubra]
MAGQLPSGTINIPTNMYPQTPYSFEIKKGKKAYLFLKNRKCYLGWVFKMSVVSGVISRQVLPACGSLCFFCPAMRARSRQPVKRYKKLIADIFPRSQEEEPNERKIGKLCEYAAKNPLRIPKITSSLEQRCYKELRIENFRSAKVVMCIYRKLLISCKEQ